MCKRILAVIRTSTEQQELESQKNDMKSFILNLGFKADEIEWYETAGASARKANKKYLDMLDAIKTKVLNDGIKYVAFWHLNRLGRIESYINIMKEFFVSNKVQVYVKTPSLALLNDDFTVNAGANISWSVFASIVAYDTEEMMEKFKRGKAENKRQGKYNGGHIQFGFKVNGDGKIIEDIEEMKIVSMLYEEYSSGKWSSHKLFKELKERGIKARGKNLADSSIISILNNELYKQYVGVELWNKVKEIRMNNTPKQNNKCTKHTYLGTGILKCHCGGNYLGDGDSYVCYRHKYGKVRDLESTCNAPSIKAAVIDEILWYVASAYHTMWLSTVNTQAIDENEKRKKVINEKLYTLGVELKKIEDKKERVQDMYADMEIDKNKYKNLLSKLNNELTEIQTKLASLTREYINIENSIKTLKEGNFYEGVNKLVGMMDIKDDNKKYEIVRQHLETITFEECDFNNRVCFKIHLTAKNGDTYTYIYDRWVRSPKKEYLYRVIDGKIDTFHKVLED